MAFLKGFFETVGGAWLVGAGIVVGGLTFGGAAALSALMISAGSGLVLSGIGTMLTKGPLQGFATASKNPVAPWNGVYGRARVGGTLVYDNTFGDSDKWRDLVFILACHPCQSVDELLFDQQRIQIDTSHTYTGSGAPGSSPVNTSFSPVQKDPSISNISRVGNVVTVHLSNDIPLLSDGDQMIIQNVHPVSAGLNGKFPVTVISHGPGNVMVFSYLSGGTAISIPAFPGSETGDAHTTWADYGRKVYMESMLGTQTLGQTFYGMLYGTPEDGDGSNLALTPGGSTINPWVSNCSLVGMTAVFLRLHYNDAIFANGLPQISFHISGKNDIWDPETSTHGYTENAALCIADYLSNTKWGFKATYGTDIPNAQLIAAKHVCDEAVTLAEGGTEPRYTCNGGWVMTTKKGEVLSNLLTSCAGRLTEYDGQLIIWPGAYGLQEVYGSRTSRTFTGGDWTTPAPTSGAITGGSIYSLATGAFRWKLISISDLYNGVKGTFISPVNNWQSTDFPSYAQDVVHGYASDANMTADGGVRRWYDVQFPFTISCPTAQRLARIELMRRRQFGTGTFLLNMAGYQFTPMDVIAMDLSYLAWTGKALEVLATRLKMESHGGSTALLGVELDVQETDPSIYAWSIGEELSPAGYQQAITPSTFTPGPPTNVILTNGAASIIVTWTTPADGYILNGGHIEIEYQILASPEGLWFSLAKMDPSATMATIGNLILNDQYNVRIRSVNAAGIPSAWIIGTPAGGSAPGPITIRASLPINAGFELPISGDPLFTAKNFGLKLNYTLAEDGTPLPQAVLYGDPPLTIFSDLTVAPAITGIAVNSGGSIAAGDYVVAISGYDTASAITRLSNFFAVNVSSGSSKLTITVNWPAGSFGGKIYVASPDDSRGFHFEADTPDAHTSTLGSLTEDLATVTGIEVGPPDDEFDHPVIRVSRELVSGPFAQTVIPNGVAVNTLSFGWDGTHALTANQFVGRILSKLANAIENSDTNIPIQDFTVTANSIHGDFTVTPDPMAAGCSPGDFFTMRTGGPSASVGLTATGTSYTDPLFDNAFNIGGLTDHGNGGNIALVIGGKGAFQIPQTVVDNSTTTVTVSPGWDIIPDSTSSIVLLENTSQVNLPGGQIQLANYTNWQHLLGIVPIANYPAKVVRVELYAADANGVVGPQNTVAFREGYVWGAGGTRLVSADATQLLTDGTIVCDTTARAITVQCLGLTSTPPAPNVLLTVQKVSSDANAATAIPPNGEAFQDGTTSEALLNQGDAVQIKIKGL